MAGLQYGEAVGEVIHFDYLHPGGTDGVGVVSKETDLEYSLVIAEDIRRVCFAGARAAIYGCQHRASPDQMVCPTKGAESALHAENLL